MSTIDDAAEVIGRFAEDAARALAAEGHLAPDLTIIRTVEELEALDPDTMVWGRHHGPFAVGALTPDPFAPERTPPLPAVVICEAADVRAARKALKEATA